jgi:FMN-dependent NADH-azoreductase
LVKRTWRKGLKIFRKFFGAKRFEFVAAEIANKNTKPKQNQQAQFKFHYRTTGKVTEDTV